MHYIGICVVNEEYNNLEMNLEPYDEQTDNSEYLEFIDCTDELNEVFANLPEKETDTSYPCDKEHYPTIEALAEKWYGYKKNEDGVYGYITNPSAKWDWYSIGNRWDGYLLDKKGNGHNALPFDEVDWEKMFIPKEEGGWNRVPACFVDDKGEWYDGPDEFGENSRWKEQVEKFIEDYQLLPDEERKNLMVYAVDFHI